MYDTSDPSLVITHHFQHGIRTGLYLHRTSVIMGCGDSLSLQELISALGCMPCLRDLSLSGIDLKRNSSLDKVLMYVLQRAAEGGVQLERLVVEDAPGLGTATVSGWVAFQELPYREGIWPGLWEGGREGGREPVGLMVMPFVIGLREGKARGMCCRGRLRGRYDWRGWW